MPTISNAQLIEFDGRAALLSPRATRIAEMLAAANAEQVEGYDAAQSAELMYGRPFERTESKPFPFTKGVAVIPITGVLLNRYPYVGSYASGYGAIRSMLDAALVDPEVKQIAFDVNSPGGMVQGCFELAEHIFASRKLKKSTSIVDANCCSAAFALGSSATRVVATRSADIGAIGVLRTHIDVSKRMENDGVKVTFVHAGEHKVDGNPYEPLPKDVKAQWQKEIDDTYDQFVSLVARNRGIEESAVRETEAQIYGAEEAKEIGLIDAVASPQEAFAALVTEQSRFVSTPGDRQMSVEENVGGAPGSAPAIDADAVKAEAATAERARVSAILSCDEAKGKTALANHLAMKTGLTAEESKAILAASAAEPVPTAPVVAAPSASAFEQAMATGNPEVPAGGGADEEKETLSARILRNYRAATGHSKK